MSEDARRDRRDRYSAALRWLLAASVLGVYVLFLFYPLVQHLWRGGPAAWIEGDVAEEYGPDLVTLCRGLWRGHLPLWNPYEHGGAPFYADPQAGAYYPPNWAICALAGPAPSFHWADARVVLHFYLASLLMAGFLRGEKLGWPAALAGAALFPLSPFFRHNWELNLTSGLAYLPLLLLLARSVTRRPTAARAATLGLGAALATLAGSPPGLFYVGLVVAPFTLHASWSAVRAGVPWRRLAANLALAGVVATALVLPMFAPARELAALSVRSHPDLAMIAQGGLAPSRLFGVVLPALDEHTYVGLLALALVPWAFAGYRPAWLFAAVGAVGLVLMLGEHTPVFRAVYRFVPGAAQFRDPARYSALWGTSVVVLAAAGLDALGRRSWADASARRWANVLSLAGVGCLVVAAAPTLDPLTHGKGLGVAGGVLVLGALAVVLLRDRVMVGAVGVLCCVELVPALPAARHTRPGPFPEGRATLDALRGVAGDDLDAYRTYDEFAIHMRSGSRFALRDFRGYQDPLSLGRYQKVLGELERTPLLLASFNVRWVLWGPHYIYGSGHHFLADPAGWGILRTPETAGSASAGKRIYEVPGALPMAYWMDGAEVVADADAALERVRAAAPAPRIVLEAAEGALAGRGTGAYVAAKVERGPERLTVDVTAPSDGFVVINEARYPGWEASVDGRPVAIRRANSLVMAVPLSAGVHRIALAFRPWEPRVAEPAAGLFLVLVAALYAVAAYRLGRER